MRSGELIHDRACFSFVTDLEAVIAEIDKITTAEPQRAVALYETFLAGCHAKADQLDDSSGSFGQFAHDLICRWIKARQVSGAGADATVSTLMAWMDDDPYGFCYGIEKDAAAALDRTGLAAFERRVRERLEAAAAGAQGGSPLTRWSAILRAIYVARADAEAYLALTQERELTSEDCLALARMFVRRRKPVEALAWAERGIGIDGQRPFRSTAAYELVRLHRELLTKLGRQAEALESAWADFCRHPSKDSYDDLMKFVPKAARGEWHVRALDAATAADLAALLELLVETRETERLAKLVGGATDKALESVSHYATEPAARRMEKGHPGLAARLWRAQGMRIVEAKKSKYYDAALSNFERARDCYRRTGLTDEWEGTVRQVRARHGRKSGFIPGFEALAAGAKRRAQPSFLESAKARWSERHGSER